MKTPTLSIVGVPTKKGQPSAFFSWSGQLSHSMASVVYHYWQNILPEFGKFFSSRDIVPGSPGYVTMLNEALKARIGLLFYTKENLGNLWMQFEAGLVIKTPLSMVAGENVTTDPSWAQQVAPILVDVAPSDLPETINGLQSIVYDNEEAWLNLFVQLYDQHAGQFVNQTNSGQFFNSARANVSQMVGEMIRIADEAKGNVVHEVRSKIMHQVYETTKLLKKYDKTAHRFELVIINSRTRSELLKIKSLDSSFDLDIFPTFEYIRRVITPVISALRSGDDFRTVSSLDFWGRDVPLLENKRKHEAHLLRNANRKAIKAGANIRRLIPVQEEVIRLFQPDLSKSEIESSPHYTQYQLVVRVVAEIRKIDAALSDADAKKSADQRDRFINHLVIVPNDYFEEEGVHTPYLVVNNIADKLWFRMYVTQPTDEGAWRKVRYEFKRSDEEITDIYDGTFDDLMGPKYYKVNIREFEQDINGYFNNPVV